MNWKFQMKGLLQKFKMSVTPGPTNASFYYLHLATALGLEMCGAFPYLCYRNGGGLCVHVMHFYTSQRKVEWIDTLNVHVLSSRIQK